MANIYWLNAVSGDFNTGTNWSGGTVPGVADNVFIDATGAPFTVTDSHVGAQQVHTLQVAANATFVIGYEDNFQALYGGANAGTIELTGPGSEFVLANGTFSNSGVLSLSGAGGRGELILEGAVPVTLNGGGQVSLNGNGAEIYGYPGATLINVDNTISGAGFINTYGTNESKGVIDATNAGALFISDDSITNDGLIEATGTVANTYLDIRRGANVDQSGGGVILAANGATAILENVRIVGGTLTTVGTGVINIGFDNTVLDGSGVVLANKAILNLAANYSGGQYVATLEGAIANSGIINVATGGNTGGATDLIVDAAGVTLTGAGSINLVTAAAAVVGASGGGSTLTNVDNTIAGEGGIGANNLTLINDAEGVINANAAGALTLDTGTTTTSNAGLIEATGAGGLTIASAITNTGALLAMGGTLSISGDLTNLSGTSLTGGTFQADTASTLDFGAGAKIVTDNATLILSGANSVTQGSAPIEATLTTIGKSGALEILAGRNWTSTVALSNAGTLQLGGATFTAPSLTDSGTISGFGTVAAALTLSGAISVQANKTLSLKGGSLTNLTGTTLTGGRYTVGAGGVFQLANNTSIVSLDATIDLAGVGAVVQGLNTGTSAEVSLDSSLTSIGAAGTLKILGGRNYTTANAVGNSGVIQLGGGIFTSGALTSAAGSTLTGFGSVASVSNDAGATTSAGGALVFTAAGNTFSGAISGTEIDFAGGTDLLQSGSSLTAATVGVSGAAVVTLGANLAFAGKLTQTNGTTLALGANTLTLSGKGSTLAGTVSGSGASLFFTGGTQAINGGAALSVSNWSVTGGATTINEILAYKGAFSEGAGATVTLSAGDKFTLTGATTLSGTVNGASRVKVSSATLSGLTIGGTVTLEDAGAFAQTETIVVGDGTTKAATLSIDAGATYTISGGGIARGAATKSSVDNSGTLTDSATGLSVVAVQVVDTGSMVAATGTLDLSARLTGTGGMSVDSGAALEADSTSASTLSMTFNGGNAVLALKNPSNFAATINGFAATDIIDLLSTKATSAVLEAGDILLITNKTKTVATLQLAGNYTGDTFIVSSDESGGTDITVSTGGAFVPPAHQFIAAMAGLAGQAGGAIHRDYATPVHEPVLSKPRAMIA